MLACDFCPAKSYAWVYFNVFMRQLFENSYDWMRISINRLLFIMFLYLLCEFNLYDITNSWFQAKLPFSHNYSHSYIKPLLIHLRYAILHHDWASYHSLQHVWNAAINAVSKCSSRYIARWRGIKCGHVEGFCFFLPP